MLNAVKELFGDEFVDRRRNGRDLPSMALVRVFAVGRAGTCRREVVDEGNRVEKKPGFLRGWAQSSLQAVRPFLEGRWRRWGGS